MPDRRAFLRGAATASAWMLVPGGRSPDAAVEPGSGAGSVAQAGIGPANPGQEGAGVRARILGIAQDGGLPHLGCRRACCVAARHDPRRARRVAALGLYVSGGGPVILVDATPDLRSQIEELRGASGAPEPPGLPVDAVLLTHAHVGHYAGLIHLGREAMAARSVPVCATRRMGAFLRENKPGRRLAEWGHLEIREIEPGAPRRLADALSVEAIAVPHRDEDSDTVGFIFAGPSRRLLYVPDTDAWERWPRRISELLGDVDVAVLDGTFFDGDELPGRDLTQIPHPMVRSTMDHLESRVRAGRPRVLFTHLNHTNPALDPLSDASAEISRRGFAVAAEGMEFAL